MGGQHVNPDQLRLFLDPVVHQQTVQESSDAHGPGMMGESGKLWQRKEAEARQPEGDYAHGAGIYDMLARGEQIRNPVRVLTSPEAGSPMMQHEGHHRVAAAAAVQRDTGRAQHVPVEYHSDHGEAWDADNDAEARDWARQQGYPTQPAKTDRYTTTRYT